ncbi:hypothetical protein EFK50_15140 [Nocardioides marmoriginsengisoli]|uniref:Uncharacterized protein n=1 Tax=Nocardioides marmoriginsengisoli TaxID=661483 RepID=A0A3N0CHT6_9ACTN|nr:DUF5719 family protein [Nocardioides marmoriginsengisoli]RNL63047.1 hypothetical protein EFK50_15140 [Nocardioides marmoriginsengisoli]
MTTAPGRRATNRATTKPDRTAVLGVMLVGLTVVMLTLAGNTPSGIGRAVDPGSRVKLDERIFTCTGGIKGSVARTGDLTTGLSADLAVEAGPRRFDVDTDLAQGAFAGQQARTSKTLAWTPCPEPRARWWFVGAGAAAVTHDSVLTVSNPRSGAAVIDIDVFGPEGVVASPGLHGITLAAGATRSFDLARTAPLVGNLAFRVLAKRGLVAASVADRFALGGIGSEVDEWLPAQSLPAAEITLAGLPAKPTTAALMVVNPGEVDAIARVKVIGATGTFAPKDLLPVTIPPKSVATVPIRTVLDGTPMALQISASRPVTATVRSIKGGDVAFATGVRVIRGSTAVVLPDGSGQLVLSSLRTGAGLRVATYDAAGKVLGDRTVKVPARTSVPVRLPAKARYLRLVSDRADVVGGFVIEGERGITAAGVLPAIRSIRLPQVRPGW